MMALNSYEKDWLMSKTFQIEPGQKLQGTVTVPGDKSISHRAVILGALAEGDTEIEGFLEARDTLATLHAMHELGVQYKSMADGYLVIHGVGLHGLKAPTKPLDCGNSGTAMRLLAGVLAAQPFDSVLTGDESLLRRPMMRVVGPLKEMGAKIETSEAGTAPLKIYGGQQLTAIKHAMPVASAQLKSCLLLAGLYADGDTCVEEPLVTRDHTERLLQEFGYEVNRQRPYVKLKKGGKLTGQHIIVPGDMSSAAFFMIGAAISDDSDVTIKNVGINPTRIGAINILRIMGAKIYIENERWEDGEPMADIRVRSSTLQGVDIPIDQVPLAIDEFPALFIAAACATGVTVVREAEELRQKESDRIQLMASGLRQIGVNVETRDDGIAIEGDKNTIKGGTVTTGGDHRVAMAFTIAGLVAQGPIIIEDCDRVATSFPSFTEIASQLGLQIKVSEGENVS